MERWDSIRELARAKRAEVGSDAMDDSAQALLEAAARATGITPRPVQAGDSLLCGGSATFDPDAGSIWYDRTLEPAQLHEYLGHEFGHVWMDGCKRNCDPEDFDLEPTEAGQPMGTNRVEGYSPFERQEMQANLFAREYLLPAQLLRRWYQEEHLTASQIAAKVGVSEGFVVPQLAYALLIPPTPNVFGKPMVEKVEKPLDPDQKQAAEMETGPLLVEAGPGTGKTRTLVGRIQYLVQARRVDSKHILVLTFSNQAAEELRTRVARYLPYRAIDLWAGTFHAFGLELLRKYGDRIGLPTNPRVLDPVAALFLLERLLPALQLQHYQNLYDPILPLRDMLTAISRAKDELVGPAGYAELAAQMRARAKVEDLAAIEAAEKAHEVARVYQIYQAQLEQEGLLDYGDLIAKSVDLLEQCSDVKCAVQADYPHILVDEYQDVNRASARLLQQIAGEGAGLWVVGDVRQSIYRFRGAAPHNMRAFAEDFPGGQIRQLRHNYRSLPTVVKVLNHLAPRMHAGQDLTFSEWMADREETDGLVHLENAADRSAEGKGLAREIERLHAVGVAYCDQAVLCRSHGELDRIGAYLEEEGIPILYLGDLFERTEIRDLLALLSIASGPDGVGLLRVGRFPEYAVPLDDILRLIEAADAQQMPFPHALSLATTLTSLSAQGRAGLVRLANHLENVAYRSGARQTLAQYLFSTSQYLTPLLAKATNQAQQQRLAIFQLLEFAGAFDHIPAGSEDPKRVFLEHIRRIEVLGEEKQVSQLPETGLAMDAVRLLTIHASKGLEFSAVFLPNLARGSFPFTRGGWSACPPPPGLIPWAGVDEAMEEDECLFFVALSRAKDYLCLSRPTHVGGKNSNPSEFLTLVAKVLPQSPTGPVTWAETDPAPVMEPPMVGAGRDSEVYEVDALDRYLRCPCGYYFQVFLGLRGGREDGAYRRLQHCLREVLAWVREAAEGGNRVAEGAILDHLNAVWAVRGPVDHPFEPLYREVAQALISGAVRNGLIARPAMARTPIELALETGRVRFTPDHLEMDSSGKQIYRRLKTKPVDAKDDDPVYGLYFLAASNTGVPFEIQMASLASGEVLPVPLTPKTAGTRAAKYASAIAGIQNKIFPPRPKDARDCPRCSFYFVCAPPGEEE